LGALWTDGDIQRLLSTWLRPGFLRTRAPTPGDQIAPGRRAWYDRHERTRKRRPRHSPRSWASELHRLGPGGREVPLRAASERHDENADGE
jgi:hypothetical protein